jgi:hypothetical protein
MGKYLDWIKQEKIDVQLGKRGLKYHPSVPSDIRDKINSKRSQVIAELLFDDNDDKAPLMAALRKQRREATTSMASDFELEVAKTKVDCDGKALFAGEYGEFWIVKDNDVKLGDNRPFFTLAELYLIRDCTEEQLAEIYKIKSLTAGEITPDNTMYFKEDK